MRFAEKWENFFIYIKRKNINSIRGILDDSDYAISRKRF